MIHTEYVVLSRSVPEARALAADLLKAAAQVDPGEQSALPFEAPRSTSRKRPSLRHKTRKARPIGQTTQGVEGAAIASVTDEEAEHAYERDKNGECCHCDRPEHDRIHLRKRDARS
jgi:hypothetical protein